MIHNTSRYLCIRCSIFLSIYSSLLNSPCLREVNIGYKMKILFTYQNSMREVNIAHKMIPTRYSLLFLVSDSTVNTFLIVYSHEISFFFFILMSLLFHFVSHAYCFLEIFQRHCLLAFVMTRVSIRYEAPHSVEVRARYVGQTSTCLPPHDHT